MPCNMKTGVILINLGTPDSLTYTSIWRYLREFLLDPRVIDLNPVLRRLLVYGLILPFRPFKTLKAYQKIWSSLGSPLRYHTENLTSRVQAHLGKDYTVVMAMRYGSPSIQSALSALKDCKALIALPLFPQYSSAATGSAIEKFMSEASKLWNIPKISIINQFFDHSAFIDPYVKLIKPYIADKKTFLLLSYHGLPVRHIDKSNCTAICTRKQPCPSGTNENYFCYRAQCYETSKLLAHGLSLPNERYMTAFQSRLGRTEWIKPYTDQLLSDLRTRGITHLAIACPAFVADCLETLEEIGIQAKKQWLALGGESFTLIPCLNDDPKWCEGAAKWILSGKNKSSAHTDQ